MKEFERGKGDGDLLRMRDAAESVWNLVVQATKDSLKRMVYPFPQSHFDRRKGFIELTKRDIELRTLA